MCLFEKLLTAYIRDDPVVADMLAIYKSKPAFFFQKAPQDADRGWYASKYPRADYIVNRRYDPERGSAGGLNVNIWCNAECAFMPEDIDKKFVELISGTFFSSNNGEWDTICAIWDHSNIFNYEMRVITGDNTSPEVFGITASFDLFAFPSQLTCDPDPILALNSWTKINFPDLTILNYDTLPEIWKPSDENPIIFWRFEGNNSSNHQSFSVNWYDAQFAAHVLAGSVAGRNRLIKEIVEKLQLDGEVLLPDNSPVFISKIALKHSLNPLRDGQILLSGRYGVLTQPGKKEKTLPLLNVFIPNLNMEVKEND